MTWLNLHNFSKDFLLDVFHSGKIPKDIRSKNKSYIKENYNLALKEQKDGKSVLSCMPSRAKMSLTALCNIKCVFCHPCRMIPEKRENGTLFPSEKVVIEWLRLIPSLMSLELFREGESFLNRDFLKFAHFARNMGVQHITNSTNGTTLSKRISEGVVEVPLDALKFSIQGANNESVKRMMPGASWDKIKQNIEYLRNLIKKHPSKKPKMLWSMVLCSHNMDQLVPALQQAIKWNFNSFSIHYIGIWGPEIDHLGIRGNDLKYANQLIFEAKCIAEKNGIHFMHPKLDIETISNPRTEKPVGYLRSQCFWPWQNLELEASGKVIPCCGGQPSLGDLNNIDIAEIWNSNKLVSIRRGLTDGKLDTICKRCRYGFK